MTIHAGRSRKDSPANNSVEKDMLSLMNHTPDKQIQMLLLLIATLFIDGCDSVHIRKVYEENYLPISKICVLLPSDDLKVSKINGKKQGFHDFDEYEFKPGVYSLAVKYVSKTGIEGVNLESHEDVNIAFNCDSNNIYKLYAQIDFSFGMMGWRPGIKKIDSDDPDAEQVIHERNKRLAIFGY